MPFDLTSGVDRPFNKSSNKPLYINASSNHPLSVLKQIPKSVSKRITRTLVMKIFSVKVLRFTIRFYGTVDLMRTSNTAQKDWCHQEEEGGTVPGTSYCTIFLSANVKTNVGKHFSKLLKKHFDKNHNYQKIFNKNNMKVSYSCMNNMTKIFAIVGILTTDRLKINA